MALLFRCACLLALIWSASPIGAFSDEPAFDFNAYYGETQESGGEARRQVRQALLEYFPPGTQATAVVAFFDDLAQQTDDGNGDPLNIRYCDKRPGGRGYACIWFTDIPQDMRDDALAEGIYGLTWEIVIDVDEEDSVSDFSVDFLIERL